MIRKCSEPHQHALVFKGWNLITSSSPSLLVAQQSGLLPEPCVVSVLRAGSGIPDRYSSTVFGFLVVVAGLRLEGLTFCMLDML